MYRHRILHESLQSDENSKFQVPTDVERRGRFANCLQKHNSQANSDPHLPISPNSHKTSRGQ